MSGYEYELQREVGETVIAVRQQMFNVAIVRGSKIDWAYGYEDSW